MRIRSQMLLIAAFLLVTIPYTLAHLTGEKLQIFQYNAELVSVAPIVDGYLDDPAWEDILTSKLQQEVITGNAWPAESSDFTGRFAAVWRSGFLYIAIHLTDDGLEKHQSKIMHEDHLILYLDPHHTGYKDELYRYEIPVQRKIKYMKSPLTRVAWGNDGKTCELSFRLDTVAAKGNSIGFGISYNDVDEGRLENKIAWAPTGYTEENTRLGDLVFTAKIEPNRQQKLIQWGKIKSLY